MRFEIVGFNSNNAANDLINIEGIEGTIESIDTKFKDGGLITIAAIITITSGTLTIAEKIYNWYQMWKSSNEKNNEKVEQVILISSKDDRILLETSSVAELKSFLDSEFKK